MSLNVKVNIFLINEIVVETNPARFRCATQLKEFIKPDGYSNIY